MENLLYAEFKRKFSASFYKTLKINMCEMTFTKDFINTTRGDLYPILSKTEDCAEAVEHNRYVLRGGSIKRMMCQFFPYATYEITAQIEDGEAGFCFILPDGVEASIVLANEKVRYACRDTALEFPMPEIFGPEVTMLVSCRPGAFDIYLKYNDAAEFFTSIGESAFGDSLAYSRFINTTAALSASGKVVVKSVCSYIDNGISIADIRPIRYENGEIMIEHGKAYVTASIRMHRNTFQGIFSWVPGTAEFALTGALFYDKGDDRWFGAVAASMLYHRKEQKWYLWVCSFGKEHILAHAIFDGDLRFGVNVVDIKLMEPASPDSALSDFVGFGGDEDPDFFYDEKNDRWLMAICRPDPSIKHFRYFFFESKEPFSGYRCIGQGLDGHETGGSFVSVNGELYFLCGNSYDVKSQYRIYHKDGMTTAKFNFPDGGCRGWGSLIPIKMGGRMRYFWLTFDRHLGSDYNWSYGNIYCFEAP